MSELRIIKCEATSTNVIVYFSHALDQVGDIYRKVADHIWVNQLIELDTNQGQRAGIRAR